MTERDDRVLLATTWNGNESGTLWEALWYRQDGRFYKKVCASGLFVGPHAFEDENAFWAAFEADQAQFHGKRAGDGGS